MEDKKRAELLEKTRHAEAERKARAQERKQVVDISECKYSYFIRSEPYYLSVFLI